VYGSPRLNNKDDPVDELFFILLSQMTTGPSYERVFDRLKAAVTAWDSLLLYTVDALQELIADAGLSNQKAPRLLAIARQLSNDFGCVTLTPACTWPDVQIEHYLTNLPGVGTKTAKCVMMYSMGRRVLPADTHVRRVALRLGLIDPAVIRYSLHERLEATVAPGDRYAFHVNALAHGRAVCRALRPACHACVLSDVCPSAQLWATGGVTTLRPPEATPRPSARRPTSSRG
jgi:endonuclease III